MVIETERTNYDETPNCDLLYREMWSFIKSVMKTIFFKLYMNFIGAVYMFKENTYQRPRRLPDYGQLGETESLIIFSSWVSS